MGTNSAKTASTSGYFPQVGDTLADIGTVLNRITGMREENNAWSAGQAEIQRDWQEQQNKIAMDFNAVEAAKNRDWQKMMSDTAHQREIRDLKAAGLNPVLSAMGGNGAAVTSGATASGVTSSGAKGDTDMSSAQAMVGILSSFINAQTQLAVSNNNAITNLAVADKYTAMSKFAAELQSETQLNTATINAMASRYAADTHADATKVAAAIHAAASRYGYDVSAMTQKEIAAFNAQVNKEMQEAGFKQEFDVKKQFPSNLWQALGNTDLYNQAGGLFDYITELLGLPDFSAHGSFGGIGSKDDRGSSFGSRKDK